MNFKKVFLLSFGIVSTSVWAQEGANVSHLGPQTPRVPDGYIPYKKNSLEKSRLEKLEHEWLPTYSGRRGNPEFESEDAAEHASITLCDDLRDPNNFRLTFFGFGLGSSRVGDVNASFPTSLVKASTKHREQLIQCSAVKITLERWVVAGHLRAMDADVPMVKLLGLIGGDLTRPALGKYGAYASISSSCVARPESEVKLLRKFYQCTQFEADYQDTKTKLEKARARAFSTVEYYEGRLKDLENSKPEACSENKMEIEKLNPSVTDFTKLDDLQCVKR